MKAIKNLPENFQHLESETYISNLPSESNHITQKEEDMGKGMIVLIFKKDSNWKGELYPNFEKESEEKPFNEKRESVEKHIKEIEEILNG